MSRRHEMDDVDRVSVINADERRCSYDGLGLLSMDRTEAVYLVANRAGWDSDRAKQAFSRWVDRQRGARNQVRVR